MHDLEKQLNHSGQQECGGRGGGGFTLDEQNLELDIWRVHLYVLIILNHYKST